MNIKNKIKKNNIVNNIVHKKSTINNTIISKMYDEICIISTNIKNSIYSIFKNNKKISVNDGLNFHLQNAIANSTHEKTTTNLNINKKSNISRQAYENRSSLFGYEELKIISDNLFVDNSTKNDELVNYIDGTNINIYDKTNKNGYKNINILGVNNNNNNGFLFTNNIIDLNANSEIKLFYKLIEINPFEKNEIIVVDRYYFSNKFINICNKKNLKFIARIKSNSISLDKFNNYINDPTKKLDYNPFNYKCDFYGNEIRIITFKSNKDYIHLASNLKHNKKRDDNYFKKQYGNRWNVEIFFKHIKKNSSIDRITTHKLESINNIILSSSINQIIISKIIAVYNKLNNDNNKTIDITNFYNLYANHLMYKILNNTLSFDEYKNLIILSISFYKKIIDKKKSNERYAIMTYYKWHYKFISNLDKNNKKEVVDKIGKNR